MQSFVSTQGIPATGIEEEGGRSGSRVGTEFLGRATLASGLSFQIVPFNPVQSILIARRCHQHRPSLAQFYFSNSSPESRTRMPPLRAKGDSPIQRVFLYLLFQIGPNRGLKFSPSPCPTWLYFYQIRDRNASRFFVYMRLPGTTRNFDHSKGVKSAETQE